MSRRVLRVMVVMVVATWLITAVLYPWLPDPMPVHWNLHGRVDGWGARWWAAPLLPALLTGLAGLLWLLPRLSPRGFEVERFGAAYGYFVLVVMGGMLYIHGLLLAAALTGRLNITRALLAGVLVMLGLMGGGLTRVRRNYWVGVRTPWTLSHERVWDATHRLASRLLVAAAVLGLVLVVLPCPLPVVFGGVMVMILLAAFIPVFYSLWYYERLRRRGEV
jgi:uncharacterized membrane protein